MQHHDKGEIIIEEADIKKVLTQNLPINVVLLKFKEFLQTPKVKNPLLNRMVTRAKLNPGYTTLDFVKWFIEDVGYLLDGTPYAANTYTMQMFLKMVWETSLLSIELIHNIKHNILLPT